MIYSAKPNGYFSRKPIGNKGLCSSTRSAYGFEIKAVAGTSAGSIVAALLAMGYTSNEMIKLFEYFAKDIMEISPRFLFNSMRRQRSIKLQGLASSLGIENTIKDTARLKGIKNH